MARKYPDLLPKFEEGLKYTKRVPEVCDASSPIGNSWKSMFKVETRQQAEEAMKKINCTYEWIQIEDGSYDCKITTPLMQGIKVATNGRKSFFNQVIAAYKGYVDKRNAIGKAITFKDGTYIPHDFI